VSVLLDANVLIALTFPQHVHHDAAASWFSELREPFATCPITEGSLLRTLIREGRPATTARDGLATVAGHPRHEFWPDEISYQVVPVAGVIGHRQVTDAYLAHLARTRKGRLATFDKGLAELHADVAELVPTG
jgi:toxin-antitoxin system PIN domain toxin